MQTHWDDQQCTCTRGQCGECPEHGEFHSGTNTECGCGDDPWFCSKHGQCDVKIDVAWNGAKDTIIGTGVYCMKCGELIDVI